VVVKDTSNHVGDNQCGGEREREPVS